MTLFSIGKYLLKVSSVRCKRSNSACKTYSCVVLSGRSCNINIENIQIQIKCKTIGYLIELAHLNGSYEFTLASRRCIKETSYVPFCHVRNTALNKYDVITQAAHRHDDTQCSTVRR